MARVTDFGATWTQMLVPDRQGRMGDILLGFDTPAGYLGEHPCFGSTVGRVGNRVAGGRFTLDGQTWELVCNNGPHHLHGGLLGFDKVGWQAEQTSPGSVTLRHTDPAGSNGYPGTVQATVIYTLTHDDELRLDYTATTDAATPINLTNHAYFNLGASPTVEEHLVRLFASRYTPVDETLIPTGEILQVQGTPFDFRQPRPIGPVDYDHNFVVDGPAGTLRPVARVVDPSSGRVLEISSDQPGVQFYTGNSLDGTIAGKAGQVYRKHGGFCLETQHFPDSINQSAFPSVVLRPGEIYRTTTVHRFSVAK